MGEWATTEGNQITTDKNGGSDGNDGMDQTI